MTSGDRNDSSGPKQARRRGVGREGDAFGWALAAGDFDGDGATTWPSASRTRLRLRRAAPAPSTSSTAPASGLSGARQPVLAPEQPPASWASPRRATTSARPWPRATSTATAATTWPSASRARTSGPSPTPARSTSSTARPRRLSGGTSSGTRTARRPGARPRPSDFGAALAAGDFDGDGRDDLAVGVPGESVGAVDDAGAVNVLYGTASGSGGR